MTTAACREIPASVLHELLRLDPDTGFLYWKYRSNGSKSWNNRFVGKPALTALNGKGYFHGMIFSKPVRAHQVVFAITHGRWPNGQVDHHNGDIRDNRPANLREVDRVSNARNAKLNRRNKSGVPGVQFRESSGRWLVVIGIGGGVVKHIGSFGSFDEAVAARRSAERRYEYSDRHGSPGPALTPRPESWSVAPLSGLEDPRHGTVQGYDTFECRCSHCRSAWSGYVKRLAKARRKVTILGGYKVGTDEQSEDSEPI